MKLVCNPQASNSLFLKPLQLVITVEPDGHFEVYIPEDGVKPDRHLLLGIAQSMAVQIEEKDPDTVEFADSIDVGLDLKGSTQKLVADLIIVRTLEEGAIAALVKGDAATGRRLARQAVRSLTGTIRLDVP